MKNATSERVVPFTAFEEAMAFFQREIREMGVFLTPWKKSKVLYSFFYGGEYMGCIFIKKV